METEYQYKVNKTYFTDTLHGFDDDLEKHINVNSKTNYDKPYCIPYNTNQKLNKQLGITFEAIRVTPIKFLYFRKYRYRINDTVLIKHIKGCIGHICMNPEHIILEPKNKKNIYYSINDDITEGIINRIKKDCDIWTYNGNKKGIYKDKKNNKYIDVKEYLWTLENPKNPLTSSYKLITDKDNYNPAFFKLQKKEKPKINMEKLKIKILKKCKKDNDCLLWPNKKHRKYYRYEGQNIISLIWDSNYSDDIINTQKEKILHTCNRDNCCNIQHMKKKNKFQKKKYNDKEILEMIEKKLEKKDNCLIWTGKTIRDNKYPTLTYNGKSIYVSKEYYRIKYNDGKSIKKDKDGSELIVQGSCECKNPLCFNNLKLVRRKDTISKKQRNPIQVYNDYCKNNSDKFERLDNAKEVNKLIKKMANGDSTLEYKHTTKGCYISKTIKKAIGVCVSTMIGNNNQSTVQLTKLALLSTDPKLSLDNLKNKVIRHLCNNGHLNCHEPTHLYIGTQTQNRNDHIYTNHKFTDPDTNEVIDYSLAEIIYNSGQTDFNDSNYKNQIERADGFKVSLQTIKKIDNGNIFPKTNKKSNDKRKSKNKKSKENKAKAQKKFDKDPTRFLEEGRKRITKLKEDGKIKETNYLEEKIKKLRDKSMNLEADQLQKIKDKSFYCHEYNKHSYYVISIFCLPIPLNRLSLMCYDNKVNNDQTLHKCGNNKCCNPLHLKSGTQSENEHDKIIHGTSKRKFTLNEEKEIYKLLKTKKPKMKIKTIAKKYNCSVDTIRRIKNRSIPSQ